MNWWKSNWWKSNWWKSNWFTGRAATVVAESGTGWLPARNDDDEVLALFG